MRYAEGVKGPGGRPVPVVRLVAPNVASRLFGVSDARLRRLALDGEAPHRVAHGLGGKPCRAFSWGWLVDRYGEPDPDAVRILTVAIECLEIGATVAVWELLIAHPSIRTVDGGLAVDSSEFVEQGE